MIGFFMNSPRGWYGVILRITGACLLLFFGLTLGFTVFAQAEPGQEEEAPASADPVTGTAEERALPAESGETALGEAAGEEPAEEASVAELAGEETEAPAALESGPAGLEMIPEEVRRPRKGEAPRYPRDMIIGTLGRGSAPEEAYAFARTCLEAILMKDQDSEYLNIQDSALKEDIFSGLEPVAPRKFRIGGGREEPDGSVSFLFRFIGRDQGVAGELYLRPGEAGEQEQEQQQVQEWFFDEIILEDPRGLADGKDAYQFDFSPYERFF
ncbi:MAG: hypothetical protein LBD78_06470 [Spirochaetaceae bacterium]|jgi:hypothetical protein|nr:hypothetical protein [Spirochaetaceae bacterium]